MIVCNGWTLLFHECLLEQLSRLDAAVQKAKAKDPENYLENSNVRLFNSLSQRMLVAVPDDPTREQYRLGTTMGPVYTHWKRVKIGQRFRLFFRYDSASKVIVYAWVNDSTTLRASGAKNNPYNVFRQMLDKGNPPDAWKDLIKASHSMMKSKQD